LTLAAAVGLASSGMLACPKARAGIWSTTPELSASGEYSTNPQLIPGQSQSGSALVANLGAPFGWYDEAHQVEFGLRARIAEATGSSPIGHDAYYGSFSAKTDYERGSVGLAVHWADDSAAVVSSPAAGTLTRLDIGERSTDASLNASYSFTSRLQNTFGAYGQSQHYAFLPGSGLYDYQYAAATDTLQESLTLRTQLQLALAYSSYTAPDLNYSENSESVELGWQQALTERWSYSLLFGRSKADSPEFVTRTYGTVYAGTLVFKGERTALSASLTQSFQPSGFGALTLSREATLRGDFNKTERVSGYVALRSVRTTDTLSVLAFTGRSYQSLTAGLNWAATEKWDVTLSANWQRQKIDLGDQSANGTGVLLSGVRKFGRVPLG